MEFKLESIRAKIEDQVWSSYVEEYKELIETWRDLERKAQNNVALAGIFLGGVVAFISNISAASCLIEKMFLVVIIILLLMSLFFCVLVLKTIRTAFYPKGEGVEKHANDLFALPPDEITEERYFRFIKDQARKFKRVNNLIYDANLKKAKHLRTAQVFIMLSLGVVAIAAILNIFYGGRP